jgi:hypothetical protein
MNNSFQATNATTVDPTDGGMFDHSKSSGLKGCVWPVRGGISGEILPYKTSPANGATGQSTSPTLTWSSSSGATRYEYCYDTSNDNACSNWVNNGTATSVSLSGLANNTTYYWHVRAVNAGGTTYSNGSSTAYWSFTTTSSSPPAAFNKTSPANGATGQSTSPTLTWSSSSGVTSYEYCYDTSNNNSCDSANWVSRGTNTNVT